MGLINCKECGKQISDTAKACPSCGANNTKPFWMPLIGKLIIGIVVIFILMLVIGANTSPEERQRYAKEKKLDEMCGKALEDSVTSAEKRGIREICDATRKKIKEDSEVGVVGCSSYLDMKNRAEKLGNDVGAKQYGNEYNKCIANKK